MEIITRLHLLAAMYWTGAIMLLAIVASPLVDRIRPPSFQRTFARRLWQTAHLSMWVAIVILLGTGAYLARAAGLVGRDVITLGFWMRPIGIKLALVGAMIVLSLIHDMLLGHGARLVNPNESTEPPGFYGRIIPAVVAVGAAAIAIVSYTLRT